MGDVAQRSSRRFPTPEDVGSNPTDPHPLSERAIAACVATLEALREVDPDDPARVTVERAAAHLRKSAKQRRRRDRERESHQQDREAVAGSARAAAYFRTEAATEATTEPRRLHHQRPCYVCRQPFRELHAFYHALCPACAERNFAAREATADLSGRAALDIVNVAAAEGSFSYRAKQPRHPHTNMAKAALNMFTRTSWPDYLRDGIYMNSVDPGWVSQENPHPKKLRAQAAAFCPPLDAVDGAARVIAPILRGVRGDRFAGALFRHHEPAPW